MLRKRRKTASSEERQAMETPKELRLRYEANWQNVWTNSDKGRFTYNIIPDITERLHEMIHLKDIDHTGVQLLTGHGAFGVYLHDHNKRGDDTCPNCGELDHPFHAILECPDSERERREIELAAKSNGNIGPWNLNSLLRQPGTCDLVMAKWRCIHNRRNL